MTIEFYKKKGFYFTLLASVLIVSITLITGLRKDLFVHETGNFKLFNGVGLLLAIGLLFRWRVVRHIAGTLTLIILVFIGFVVFSIESRFLVSYISLMAGLILLLILLLSKPLKKYMESKQKD